MTAGLEGLKAELRDAEGALYASEQATRTHGHQGITWQLLRADAERVYRLRELIAVGATNLRE